MQIFNVPALGRQVNAAGTFFRYESAGVDGIDQTIRLRADGQDLGTYLPGDSITLPVRASTWEITPTAATQTALVRVGNGEVQSQRLTGIVQVTNRVSPATTQLEGPASLLLNVQAVSIVAAALNPRGLLVRRVSCNVTSAAGGQADLRIVTAPVVPVTTVPMNGYNMAGAYAVGGSSAVDIHADQNYQIPANWGVWAVSNHIAVAPTAAAYGFFYEPL